MINPKRIRNALVISNILLLVLLVPNGISTFRPRLLPFPFIRICYYIADAIMLITQLYVAKGLWVLTRNRALTIFILLLCLLIVQSTILGAIRATIPTFVTVGTIGLVLKICVLVQIHRLKNEVLKSELLVFGWTLILVMVIAVAAPALVFFTHHYEINYMPYLNLIQLLYPITLFIVALKINQERAKVDDVLAAINNYPHM